MIRSLCENLIHVQRKVIIINKQQMQSYLCKKNEFENAYQNTNNVLLKLNYKLCLSQTEQSFQCYTQFYDILQLLLGDLVNLYSNFNKKTQTDIIRVIEQFKTARKLYKKEDNHKNALIDNLLNSITFPTLITTNSFELTKTGQQQPLIIQNIVDYQLQLLSMLLKEVFSILFLSIYKMDKITSIKSEIKEFLSFTSALIPIFGPKASGLTSIVNTINSSNNNVKTANETLFYLESYSETSTLWINITNGFIEILQHWKNSLVNPEST